MATQTAAGSASQTQREHPDRCRLSLTEQGSTQTAAGSASQTQRQHPDRCRLSLTDAEGAPRPLQTHLTDAEGAP